METQTIIVDEKKIQKVIKLDINEKSEIFLNDIENKDINLEDTTQIPVDKIKKNIEKDDIDG